MFDKLFAYFRPTWAYNFDRNIYLLFYMMKFFRKIGHKTVPYNYMICLQFRRWLKYSCAVALLVWQLEPRYYISCVLSFLWLKLHLRSSFRCISLLLADLGNKYWMEQVILRNYTNRTRHISMQQYTVRKGNFTTFVVNLLYISW